MNNDVLPPPPSALNDALALVRLALNPKEASDYLEQLSTQAQAHEAARNENQGKEAALAAREVKIQEVEASIVSRETAVSERELQVQALVGTLKSQQAQLVADTAALEEAKASHATAVTDLEQLKTKVEADIAVKTQEIDARMQTLTDSEAAHAAKVARLKELAA